jgi:hypothetical protein
MPKATFQRRLGSWVEADVLRFEEGLVREQWDVLQGEAAEAESVNAFPMFGDRFPAEALDLRAAITPHQIGES